MSDKVYPKGVRVFNPRQGAPVFVKGSIVITPNELYKFLKENEHLMTEYKNEKQIKLNLLEGDNGLYLVVDTYKKNDNAPEPKTDDLPF